MSDMSNLQSVVALVLEAYGPWALVCMLILICGWGAFS